MESPESCHAHSKFLSIEKALVVIIMVFTHLQSLTATASSIFAVCKPMDNAASLTYLGLQKGARIMFIWLLRTSHLMLIFIQFCGVLVEGFHPSSTTSSKTVVWSMRRWWFLWLKLWQKEWTCVLLCNRVSFCHKLSWFRYRSEQIYGNVTPVIVLILSCRCKSWICPHKSIFSASLALVDYLWAFFH